MWTDELVAAVREGSAIDTDEHALRAARATVAVLARRSAAVGRLLGTHLPQQLVGRLLEREPEIFSLGSFYGRVAVVEGPGCSPYEVQRHVRATVTAVNRGTAGQLGMLIRGDLPPEFVDLLVEVPVHRSVSDHGPRTGRSGPRPAPPVPAPRRPEHDRL